jgi:2-oxoglutarate dehydrogenase complex dehydrogenase (E1) component-like enzyme
MKKLISRRSPLLFKPSAPFSEIARFQNTFLSPANLVYIETLYESWVEDKSSVSPSFAAYFELLEKGQDPHDAYVHPSASGHTKLGSK